MEPNRYRLRGPSLAQLGAQAVEKHGPTARIVSSERISATGVGRLLGRAYYEAEVEVGGEPAEAPGPLGEGRLLEPGSGSAGEEPDAQAAAGQDEVEDVVDIAPEMIEAAQAQTPATPSERLKVRGRLPAGEAEDEDFGRMMDDLWRALKDPGAAAPAPAGKGAAPIPMRGAGALVVVAGLGADASLGVRILDAGLDARTWDPGRFEGRPLHELRRELRQVRAQAVAYGVPVVAPVSLEFPRKGVRSGAAAPVVEEADQMWAAVDVRHKPDDVRMWLAVLAEHRAVDGIILLGTDQTLTPETGHQLGVPVYQS
ncbi:hypothetical protein [Nesterenkonia populi]|uniref:hypothetical protein n=1 Tax=Nesterenkonia populi TaxID=1591087 RepID=UPI0011BE9B46|nr:hypothetical protein [Nesterenkonia populi]